MTNCNACTGPVRGGCDRLFTVYKAALIAVPELAADMITHGQSLTPDDELALQEHRQEALSELGGFLGQIGCTLPAGDIALKLDTMSIKSDTD